MNRKTPGKTMAACVLIIIAATFGAYAMTIGHGFVYDDHELILNNRWITDFRYLPQAFTSSLWSFKGMVSNTYRPVLHLVFTAEYRLFGQNPSGYHFISVALHAVNALVVFLISSFFISERDQVKPGSLRGHARVFRFPVKRGGNRWLPPLFAGLIFSLHPINSEVVSWVSAITELTYTLFLLLSFYFYIRFRAGEGRAFYQLSVLSFPLALFSKETAVMLPMLIAAYDLSGGGASFIRRWKGYLPYILVIILYMALRTASVGGLLHHKQISLSGYELLVNLFPLIFKYAWKLVLPIGLNAIYVMEYAASLWEPKAIAGVSVSAIFLATVLLSLRKRPVFICLVIIALPLLPVLYIPALSNAAFAERYLYLPSAGFALLISYGFDALLNRTDNRKTRMAVTALLALALALYSIGSVKRSLVWKDDFTLWQDTVEKSPSSKYAHYNLALAYRDRGDTGGAIGHLSEAVRLDGSYEDAHYNLGWVYDYSGDYDKAIAHYREAIRLNPDSADAYFNIGMIYKKKGLYNEAAQELKEALKIRPDYGEAKRELDGIGGGRL